jgi:hypothetical protein
MERWNCFAHALCSEDVQLWPKQTSGLKLALRPERNIQEIRL